MRKLVTFLYDSREGWDASDSTSAMLACVLLVPNLDSHAAKATFFCAAPLDAASILRISESINLQRSTSSAKVSGMMPSSSRRTRSDLGRQPQRMSQTLEASCSS